MGLGLDLRICISNKCPDDVDAVGGGITLQELQHCTLSMKQTSVEIAHFQTELLFLLFLSKPYKQIKDS